MVPHPQSYFRQVMHLLAFLDVPCYPFQRLLAINAGIRSVFPRKLSDVIIIAFPRALGPGAKRFSRLDSPVVLRSKGIPSQIAVPPGVDNHDELSQKRGTSSCIFDASLLATESSWSFSGSSSVSALPGHRWHLRHQHHGTNQQKIAYKFCPKS